MPLKHSMQKLDTTFALKYPKKSAEIKKFRGVGISASVVFIVECLQYYCYLRIARDIGALCFQKLKVQGLEGCGEVSRGFFWLVFVALGFAV